MVSEALRTRLSHALFPVVPYKVLGGLVLSSLLVKTYNHKGRETHTAEPIKLLSVIVLQSPSAHHRATAEGSPCRASGMGGHQWDGQSSTFL